MTKDTQAILDLFINTEATYYEISEAIQQYLAERFQVNELISEEQLLYLVATQLA